MSTPEQCFATRGTERRALIEPMGTGEIELHSRSAAGSDYLLAPVAVDDGHHVPASV